MGGWVHALHSHHASVHVILLLLYGACTPAPALTSTTCSPPSPADVQLGVPVRVTRKQTDKHGHYGCAYVYDGLVSQAVLFCMMGW